VDSYTVTKSGAEIAAEVPSINAACWDKQNRHADLAHFVFRLGPPIFPSKTVKSSGLYRSGKAWAALDLLLTADTIAEARDWTKARRAQP
jgi:hypothetical protein